MAQAEDIAGFIVRATPRPLLERRLDEELSPVDDDLLDAVKFRPRPEGVLEKISCSHLGCLKACGFS